MKEYRILIPKTTGNNILDTGKPQGQGSHNDRMNGVHLKTFKNYDNPVKN